MRLERTRHYLLHADEYPTRAVLYEAHAAALAELEQAEAVIAAARRYIDDAEPSATYWPRRNRLRSALAAFGSGEGDTT